MGWKPEVMVQGKWYRNALVFATKGEAEQSASNLMWRWTSVQDSRAVEVAEPATHVLEDGVLKEKGKADESP